MFGFGKKERQGSLEKPKSFWGSEIAQSQLKMSFKMFLDAGVYIILIWLILMAIYLQLQYGFGTLLHNLNIYFEAKWDVFVGLKKYFLLCQNAACTKTGYYPASVVAQVYGNWAAGVLRNVLVFTFLFALLSPIGFFLILKIFKWKAQEVARADHLRGRKILTEKELARELPTPRRLPLLRKVKLPIEYETQHLLVLGKTGMGKTTLLSQQMEVVRNENMKAIVYDFKGDYIRKFYDPERDKLLNPLDKRSVDWNIFNDIQTELDATAIATSLIPPALGEKEFWHTGARSVFLAILRTCMREDKKTNAAIWEMLSMDSEALYNKLDEHGEGAACKFIEPGAKGQTAGVLATLIQHTQIFEKMKHIDGDFSLRRWLYDENEAGWLFIVGHEQVKDLLRPLLSLSVDFLTRLTLSLPDNINRRIFFFIDEIGTLQYLPSLIDFLTEARSKGGALIAGTQDLGRLRKTYGHDLLDTLLVNFTNVLSFSIEGESAEIVSKLFGEEETTETNVHYSFGPEDLRDGMNLRKERRIKRVVLASELASLKKFEAYCKLTEGQLAKGSIEKKFIEARADVKEFEPIEHLSIEQAIKQSENIAKQSENMNEGIENI